MTQRRSAILQGAFAVVVVVSGPCPARSRDEAASDGCASPGPCVSPIDDATARLRHDERISSSQDLEVGSAVDLDGDGRREVLVEIVPERGVTGNATYLLYLGGPACRRYAGEIFALSLRPAGGAHCGALDLLAYSGGGCAGLAGAGEVLVFDGAVYRPAPARRFECECPIEVPDPSRDPRCPRG